MLERNVRENLLKSKFCLGRALTHILTDVSYLKYGENKIAYLSCLKDAASGRILGFAVSEHNDRLEAYGPMEFSVKKLGKDRAYAAARHAKYLAGRGGYTIDHGNYDGSVPREKMGEVSKEEELAYMKARTLYLE